MNTTHRIALLIDADNVNCHILHAVMPRLLDMGSVPIRYTFANWRKKARKEWDELAAHYALRGIQQFDPVAGKNATDQNLTITAMDLLHSGLYDTFAIVSGDGDFTPLAIRLREAGVTVLGFGTKQHANAFAHACDHFEEVPIAESSPETTAKKPAQTKEAAAKPKQPALPKTTTAKKKQPPTANTAMHNTVAEWFKEAFRELTKNDKGCVLIGQANTHIRQKYPHYNLKEQGFAKPSSFLRSLPQQFELQQGNATYRLKSK